MQITCPGCGFTGNIPTAVAGQPIKCRKCGTQIPTSTPTLDFPQSNAVVSPGDSHRPGLPWYYHVLWVGTLIFFFLNLCGMGIYLVAWIAVVIGASARSADVAPKEIPAVLAIGGWGVVLIVVASILMTYYFSFVLVLIDVAKTVKRYCERRQ